MRLNWHMQVRKRFVCQNSDHILETGSMITSNMGYCSVDMYIVIIVSDICPFLLSPGT